MHRHDSKNNEGAKKAYEGERLVATTESRCWSFDGLTSAFIPSERARTSFSHVLGNWVRRSKTWFMTMWVRSMRIYVAALGQSGCGVHVLGRVRSIPQAQPGVTFKGMRL